jgi:uncharacterized membrane protein
LNNRQPEEKETLSSLLPVPTLRALERITGRGERGDLEREKILNFLFLFSFSFLSSCD